MGPRSIHSILPSDQWLAVVNEANRCGVPRGKFAGRLLALGLEMKRQREAAGNPVQFDDLVIKRAAR